MVGEFCRDCRIDPALCPKNMRLTLVRSERDVLSSGQILHHDYQIFGILGAGGISVTYCACSRLKPVAIKQFNPNAENRKGMRDVAAECGKFENEARRLLKIRHPNVVSVDNIIVDDDGTFILMEFLEGATLEDYLRENPVLSEQQARQLITPIFDALEAVHAEGIVHRDVKPANIMLCRDGTVKLIDFGSARQIGSSTMSAYVSNGYAPPEQYDEHSRQGAWTDVYALSAVLYRMLTGRDPQPSPVRVLHDHMQLPDHLSAACAEAVKRGLALSYADRWQSVSEMRAAMQLTDSGAKRVVQAAAKGLVHELLAELGYDPQQTKPLPEYETEYLDERETEYLDEAETAYLDERETEYPDAPETEYLDERETEYLDDRETAYLDNRETAQANAPETEYLDERETAYFDGVKTAYFDDRDTAYFDDYQTEQAQWYEEPEQGDKQAKPRAAWQLRAEQEARRKQEQKKRKRGEKEYQQAVWKRQRELELQRIQNKCEADAKRWEEQRQTEEQRARDRRENNAKQRNKQKNEPRDADSGSAAWQQAAGVSKKTKPSKAKQAKQKKAERTKPNETKQKQAEQTKPDKTKKDSSDDWAVAALLLCIAAPFAMFYYLRYTGQLPADLALQDAGLLENFLSPILIGGFLLWLGYGLVIVVLETVLGWILRRKVDLESVTVVEIAMWIVVIAAIAYVARGNMLANCADTMECVTQTVVCAADAADVPNAASLTFQSVVL